MTIKKPAAEAKNTINMEELMALLRNQAKQIESLKAKAAKAPEATKIGLFIDSFTDRRTGGTVHVLKAHLPSGGNSKPFSLLTARTIREVSNAEFDKIAAELERRQAE